ncbi:MAG TPA: CYTH domain-containing protein [Candidatus Paceibacterota bacterium]
MIEVEKSFDPDEEQLTRILEGAKFLGEIVNHDIYYDYPDLRLARKKIKLRFRNGAPELKIEKSETVDREIEDVSEIEKFLGIDAPLAQFVFKDLIEIVNYKSTRKKYIKEGINIDVDILDFGMQSCDFEVLVEREEEVKMAEEKIFEFAKRHGLDPTKQNIGKRRVYLKKFKPEIYKELYGN